MTQESHLEKQVLLALSRGPIRLFRNSVALGWVGNFAGQSEGVTLLRNARRNSFGLAVGSGDLIGWKTVTVTPDMVGKKLAVFSSLELKAPRGKIREEQLNWDRAVNLAGGLSGIVRSVEQAEALFGLSRQDAPLDGLQS